VSGQSPPPDITWEFMLIAKEPIQVDAAGGTTTPPSATWPFPNPTNYQLNQQPEEANIARRVG